ncbi:MAG TPA: thiamine-phosphate kinase [Fibrella sp.]
MPALMYSEETLIGLYARLHRRSPDQRNAINETDAELIRLPGIVGPDGGETAVWLALTTDTVAEEIQMGLLNNPYTIGWFAVLAALSDLAAVGAVPIGLLMSYQLPDQLSTGHFEQLVRGVEACAQAHQTYVLGGDTNQAEQLSVSATAIGTVPNGQFSRRIGCQAGDKLYVTPDVGRGNLLAFLNRFDHPMAEAFETQFRPVAPLALGQWIARNGSACLDTSDGLLAGLALLLTLNPAIGFRMNASMVPYIAEIQVIVAKSGMLQSVFALGQVGDYGLLFTAAAEQMPTGAVCIGEVTDEPGLWVNNRLFDYQDAAQRLNQSREPGQYLHQLTTLSHLFES